MEEKELKKRLASDLSFLGSQDFSSEKEQKVASEINLFLNMVAGPLGK